MRKIKIKNTKKKILKVSITADGKKGFFVRGKEIARLADQGKPIPEKLIINFDTPKEMLAVLTKTRRPNNIDS